MNGLGLSLPVGILIGALADRIAADPRRGHPVAGFGWCATTFEKITYRDSRASGALHSAVLVGALAVAGALARRRAASGSALAVMTAAATWAALGGTTLARTGSQMADLLATGDLDGARALLPSLCGRDPEVLDADGLARAACESVAENTSDAHVAPLFWAALGGIPGVLAYRGVNTLDAMIGNRSPRYSRFGWAAARLDDMANYLPARLTGVLVIACAGPIGGSASGAARTWRRDAARHPSPNAGVAEAAFAGALGVGLGGPTQYRYQLEIRPALGDGPAPRVADLRRAVRLSRLVQSAAVVLAVAFSAGVRTGRPACPRH
ncbi:cobalamin biosynthesis protein [Mycolicibacterium sp.]|uniref:cobalamin biosynthesis protein n=1 Tax=Mycolicibacterium sp. TaxID=2320850 RepID=UPI001E0B8956|nr:cobalamin biosynthesis protein [Mycolicibacterium sp.]MCB1290203.1 cobalamin biosynthesis protein [Mycobacterium sp.]MCB9411154.1 cobalamin biosynthesis protein [Mycolicibacterium sp.]